MTKENDAITGTIQNPTTETGARAVWPGAVYPAGGNERPCTIKPRTIEPCTIKLLCDEWLVSTRCQVKPSTYACYVTIVEKHIGPGIGGVFVGEFDNVLLFDFIKSRQLQGLAASTLRLIVFVIKSVIRLGEEQGFSTAEPLRYYVPRTRAASAHLMSGENFETLFKRLFAARNFFEAGLLVLLCTGIRVGELCGLQWGDIDLTAGFLTIRRTVSRIRNVEGKQGTSRTLLYIGAPKTGTSARDIPLPDFILSKLGERKGLDGAFVLTGTGKCMEPRGVQRRFKNLLRKCRIPDINIHSLRHTFASHWIENGFDSKALSEILGHSSVKITMDIYVHSNMNQKKNYMNRMLRV